MDGDSDRIYRNYYIDCRGERFLVKYRNALAIWSFFFIKCLQLNSTNSDKKIQRIPGNRFQHPDRDTYAIIFRTAKFP